MTRVTVVTAVRNARATIGSTLLSVAAQDHPNREHIVVDGGSVDGTVERIREQVPRIDRFVSEPDNGVYEAFNKGVRLATGDVIGFLSAGDVYASPTVLSQVAAEFEARDVDAVFGDVVIVSQDDVNRVVRHYRSGSFRPQRLARGFMPAHPTLFLRRRLYEEHGLYDESYRIAGDFEHCIRVFLKGGARYVHIPEVLVKMASGGLSNSGWRSKWKITREMRRACGTHGVPTGYVRLSLRLVSKAFELFPHAR